MVQAVEWLLYQISFTREVDMVSQLISAPSLEDLCVVIGDWQGHHHPY